jgi:predicted nuclease of restriction endonuclease-like (RecB) superfamily
MSNLDPTYKQWIAELKEKVRSAQLKAAFAVNSELIVLYWELGKMITEKQTAYGTGFLEQLSKDLTAEFPEMKGFSRRNLSSMAQFYRFYASLNWQQPVAKLKNIPDTANVQQPVAKLQKESENLISSKTEDKLTETKSQQPVDQLSVPNDIWQQPFTKIPWGHNILIFTKSSSIEEALFYIQQTVQNGWSRSVLALQLKSNLYKRKGKAINNFDHTLVSPQSDLAIETLKDPYAFDFVSIAQPYREKDIENQLVKHITKFLLELGKGFAFVGQQYHLEIAENDYYIDLLFYHTRLKCYVVIELKNTRFIPEYAGKLNFYLSAVDSLLKDDSDKPTIGIILCREKNNIEAEFSLRDLNKPIGISEFNLTEILPEELKSSLPTIEEIENEFNDE